MWFPDDVGSDVIPLTALVPMWFPTTLVPMWLPVGGGGYSERGKELTAFEGLDHGSADGPGAAGHADFLAAEESRQATWQWSPNAADD